MLSNLSNLLQIDHVNYFYLFTFVFLFCNYVLGSFAYFYVYKLKKDRFKNRKIQKEEPTKESILVDIKWSSLSMVIYVVIAYVLILLINHGYTKVYFDISEHSTSYFIFTVILFACLQDTHFYWGHRFMHSHRTIFKHTHAVHHANKNPTPFTNFSFSPLENIILGLYFILMCLFIPVHIYTVMAVFIINSIGNTIGHLGYELSTPNMNKMLDKIFINSIHHNMHHKYGYLNYGLYFPFWDKVMNTFHHKYKEERESFYKNKNGN